MPGIFRGIEFYTVNPVVEQLLGGEIYDEDILCGVTTLGWIALDTYLSGGASSITGYDFRRTWRYPYVAAPEVTISFRRYPQNGEITDLLTGLDIVKGSGETFTIRVPANSNREQSSFAFSSGQLSLEATIASVSAPELEAHKRSLAAAAWAFMSRDSSI